MDTSTTSNNVISSDKVDGTNVYNPSGEKLGSIDCVMIDKLSGRIRYAVLEFGGFLGIGADQYPLPWDLLKYDTRYDGYVVPIDKDKLKDAPRYAKGATPEYSTDYGQRVYSHYGAEWW